LDSCLGEGKGFPREVVSKGQDAGKEAFVQLAAEGFGEGREIGFSLLFAHLGGVFLIFPIIEGVVLFHLLEVLDRFQRGRDVPMPPPGHGYFLNPVPSIILAEEGGFLHDELIRIALDEDAIGVFGILQSPLGG